MKADKFDTVGFLLADAARVLRNRFDQYARTKGVTRQQWLVLIALMRQEPVKQTTLAAYLEVEPISLSRMVDRLQAAGLVKRKSSQRDRRAKVLHLTQSGKALLMELRQCGAKVLAEASEGVDPADIAWFMLTLSRFRGNLIDGATPRREGPPLSNEQAATSAS